MPLHEIENIDFHPFYLFCNIFSIIYWKYFASACMRTLYRNYTILFTLHVVSHIRYAYNSKINSLKINKWYNWNNN